MVYFTLVPGFIHGYSRVVPGKVLPGFIHGYSRVVPGKVLPGFIHGYSRVVPGKEHPGDIHSITREDQKLLVIHPRCIQGTQGAFRVYPGNSLS